MSDERRIVYRPTPTLLKFHQDDSFVRGVMGPVGCYSGDTEYLTPDGWRRFASGPAAMVAQYDPETQVISFVKPEEWHEYKGRRLFSVSCGPIDQLVSAEHKVAAYVDGVFQGLRPAELAGRRAAIPVAGVRYEGGAKQNISDALLKLQAVLLIEAKWGACWASRLNATMMVEDSQKAKKIQYIIEECGLRCTRSETDGLIILRGRMPWRIDTVPKNWWQLSPEQLQTLFRMFADWRGGFEGGAFELATSDRRLVDWLQFAAVACGWESYADLEANGTWTVFLRRGEVRAPDTVSVKDTGQNDTVYCFTVPSGYLVVRYNGRVFISGNSGKSVGCITELFYRAFRTPPCKDGVRRSRALVARRTYPELKTTTIQTFLDWYGDLGKIVYGSPITFTCKRELPDGTSVDFEVYFMPLEGPVTSVADKLKSLELTFAFVNEAPQIDGELIPHIISRLRRFPPKKLLPDDVTPWYGLWLDANPPATTSWWYQLFEIERPKGWRLFRQPGALIYDEETGEYKPNPKAENVENHVGGYDYWLNMLPGMPEPMIRSLILGEYAAPVSGKPVYPMFSSYKHVADKELEPPGRCELIVGCDWGLMPAAVVTTMDSTGRLLVLDEIVPDKDVLFEQFRDEYLLPLLFEKYRSWPVLIVGDPAGNARSAHWNDTVFANLRSFGLAAEPAPTNDIKVRIQAVEHFLRKQNGFLLSPSCVMLRDGFEGGYVYKRISKTSTVYDEKPEKNEYSHVHDALQYAALVYYSSVIRDLRAIQRRRRRANAKPASRRAIA